MSNAIAQQTNTSHKGSRLFPGHMDISISENNDTIRYELFNHWYSWSYAELRQMSIATSELENWNQDDSLRITRLKSGNFKLKDRRYKLNRTIKHRKICASTETMRKISFAYKISKKNGLGHLALYDRTDLQLSEHEFQELVLSNLSETKKE
ncbi:MAG: hypothetical protein RH948_18065 [Cyclobacteriaceae bacterium]